MFNRKDLLVKPLAQREHDLDLSIMKPLHVCPVESIDAKLCTVALRLISAKNNDCARVLMMGAHVLRSGVQAYLIDLLEKGYVNCIAMNGAGIIHDYEFALIGKTTESVAKYIQTGEFGLWQETGRLNDIINEAYATNPKVGMGEAVGAAIENDQLPYRHHSVLATAYRLGVPVTIHVGIGYDIIHEHPNCDGAATGATSYNDFLRFVGQLQHLEGGVVMNFGSAIMAPEVYLKALSMVRNVARQQNREIRHFSTLVCDLHDLPSNFQDEPSKSTAGYYFRPWKTMLVRTVRDGGESFYMKGRHTGTVPGLWSAIQHLEKT